MKLMMIFPTLAVLLTGCEMSGEGIDLPTICAGWKPITVEQADSFTEETARLILSHNEFGRAQGCW